MRFLTVVLFSLVVTLAGFAQESGEDDVRMMMQKPTGEITEATQHDPSICAPDGIAVGGYDLVSYRADTGPVMGEQKFAAKHDGLTYLFSSKKHKRQFEKRPDYYLPKYSGWCAISLALGRLTCPDYTNFKIENDQLLLFETTGFTNGRVLWNSDAQGFRVKADGNYVRILKLQ